MATVQLEVLGLNSLETLDYRIGALFNKHVAHVSQDCINRPGDDTARKITLTFNVKPVRDPDTGDCLRVSTEIEMKSAVPVYRTTAYPMEVSKAGLRFNRDIPEELDQPSLYGKGE